MGHRDMGKMGIVHVWWKRRVGHGNGTTASNLSLMLLRHILYHHKSALTSRPI